MYILAKRGILFLCVALFFEQNVAVAGEQYRENQKQDFNPDKMARHQFQKAAECRKEAERYEKRVNAGNGTNPEACRELASVFKEMAVQHDRIAQGLRSHDKKTVGDACKTTKELYEKKEKLQNQLRKDSVKHRLEERSEGRVGMERKTESDSQNGDGEGKKKSVETTSIQSEEDVQRWLNE